MPFASIYCVFFHVSSFFFDSFYLNPGHSCTCFSSETLLLSSLLFLWSPFSQWLLHGEILCLTFSCCHVETQLKLFILQRGQVISYENSETWPMPRKHELMMNSIESWLNLFLQTLDTSNLFLSSVPRIMIAKAATNSWKLSLPSPEESNLGENLTSIWHRTCHAEKAELETHETCAPPRTGRLTTFQIRWSEFGCALYFRQMQRNVRDVLGFQWYLCYLMHMPRLGPKNT